MPMLDVSEVLLDPDFMDLVTVTRRVEVVNEYGEVTVVPQAFSNVPVVITTIDPNELIRRTDGEVQPRSFTIISTFRLLGESAGRQPDVVTYLGDRYLIDHVEPYTRYGAGFVEARMTSIDYVDAAL